MTLEETRTDYDIVIVGAGIVGLALACYLKGQELRVAVLNKDDTDQYCFKS